MPELTAPNIISKQSVTYHVGNPDLPDSQLKVTLCDEVLNDSTPHKIIRPSEILIHTRSDKISPYVEGLARCINAGIKDPSHYEFISHELVQVFDNDGGYTGADGTHFRSTVSELGYALNQHFSKYTGSEIVEPSVKRPREDELIGKTYKITPPRQRSLYITVNDVKTDLDGQEVLKPFELFVNGGDQSDHQWRTALTTLTSAVFRQSNSAQHIIDELKGVTSADGYFAPGFQQVSSVVSHIARVVEKHSIELMQQTATPNSTQHSSDVVQVASP
jgi:hypothetical protein